MADLGVMVPIAVALIVSNGLAPTAVLLPPALLYLVSAFRYRLPVPVQPLKAFGADGARLSRWPVSIVLRF